MKKLLFYIGLILIALPLRAQTVEGVNYRIDGKQLVLVIGPAASAHTRDSVLKHCGFEGRETPDEGARSSKGWRLQTRLAGSLILEKAMDELSGPSGVEEMDRSINAWSGSLKKLPPKLRGRKYVAPSFKKHITVKQLADGRSLFYLPDHLHAKRVYLSGDFNEWSTTDERMFRSDSGWTVRVQLKDPLHHYKFVVDDRWLLDPHNQLRSDDGMGNTNSVAVVPNVNLRLEGHANARRVYLSGSFNSWNERELLLKKRNGAWQLSLYLQPGTHLYKFIVDGEWITDPANAEETVTAEGYRNSVLSIGNAVRFELKGYGDARQVVLSGSFNDWQKGELLMKKTYNGWQLPYVLPPGRYYYKFVVDGEWMADPENPLALYEFENKNSLLNVGPNHLFKLPAHHEAYEVYLTGSFNNWTEPGFLMQKTESGWELPLYLEPGKHLYKFVVDGQWIIDPANDSYEPNAWGADNSVLWLE